MLDQQVRLKEGRRQREIQHIKHPFSDARYPNQQRNSSPYSPEQNKYLPPLHYQQSRREEDMDKTQIYLNNCEEIIRNLRELKNKKQKWQAPTYSHPPIRQEPQKQKSANQYQYYPKINYFSSSGSPYNKSTSLEPSFKNTRLKSTRINTLEDMKPKESNNSKNIKSKKNTEKNMQSQYQLRNNDKDEESQSPLGIRQQIKLPKKSSKVRHKVFKTVVLKKQAQQNEQLMQESKTKQRQQQEQNIQNLKKHQQELTACIVELTKCLKRLNQNNKQKQQEKNQEKIKHQKEQASQQNKQRQKQQQRHQRKISQLQSSRAKSQQKYTQVQSPPPNEDENDLETSLDSLKYKVIMALKKVNNKSHDFVVKMSGHSRLTIQHDQSYQKIPLKQQNISKPKLKTKDQEQQKQKQKQVQKSRIKKKSKQKQLQQSRLIQKQNQRQQKIRQRQKERSAQKERQKQKQKQRQNQKKNVQVSQLLKLLSSHLNQHEDQSEELSKCLRELHEYLKNQNEQIKQLKSFRDTQIINQQKKKSPQKEQVYNSHQNSPQINKTADQPPKKYMSEQQKRKNELKLQQAILKNLKKARMRGNVFKEKVQNYRKQHGMNSLQPNKQGTNEIQLQKPNPQPSIQPSKQPLKEQPAKQQKPQQPKQQQKGVIQQIKDKASNQLPKNQPPKV